MTTPLFGDPRNAVATAIIAQLGGRRFMAMTGTRHFLVTGDGVQFRIGRGALHGITLVTIALTPMDTYRVRFYRTRGVTSTLVEELDDVYCDTLRSAFTRVTGFDTRL